MFTVVKYDNWTLEKSDYHIVGYRRAELNIRGNSKRGNLNGTILRG
jgi:hypothetical protein